MNFAILKNFFNFYRECTSNLRWRWWLPKPLQQKDACALFSLLYRLINLHIARPFYHEQITAAAPTFLVLLIAYFSMRRPSPSRAFPIRISVSLMGYVISFHLNPLNEMWGCFFLARLISTRLHTYYFQANDKFVDYFQLFHNPKFSTTKFFLKLVKKFW